MIEGLVLILVAANVAITAIGLSGLVAWLRRQIGALKGAVEAQEKTINAQATQMSGLQTLVTAMDNVLKSIDEPKMLERMKAYKAIVDREKEAVLSSEAARIADEKRAMTEDQQRAVTRLVEIQSVLFGLAADVIPFIPPDGRLDFINNHLPLPTEFDEFRSRLRELAKAAPYTVLEQGFEGTRWVVVMPDRLGPGRTGGGGGAPPTTGSEPPSRPFPVIRDRGNS
jgi:hypothetical protein